MAVVGTDLWSLAMGRPQIDPHDLAAAILEQASTEPLDYRTRLLIRDSIRALQRYWGEERTATWMARSPDRPKIEAICAEEFERPGFPSLEHRLMDKTDPEDIRQFLRELSVRVQRPIRLYIGGSAALILPELLVRQTADIDVVDEVPSELRSQHELLAQLKKRYGLELAHFQSHYLPRGWDQRVHSIEPIGRIQVYLVDAYDVFLSKLFSSREKDLDDMRVLARQLDKAILARRLLETTQSALAAPDLHQRAVNNWYILYGEPLPS
jgi:hypothetical protein